MRRGTLTLPISVFIYCLAACGQSAPSGQPDIYANFVGVWVGTDHYRNDKDQDVTEDLRIEITESKKKDALECLYTYGHKGQKGFERKHRRITLDPTSAKMTSKFDGTDQDAYQTFGLSEFAVSGLGTFRAAKAEMIDGKKVLFLGLFTLDMDKFDYRWESSSDDAKTFAPFGSFSLHRESPPSTSP